MKNILLVLFIFFFLIACQNNGKKLTHSHTGTNKDEHSYDCIHCGMPTQEFPKWQSRILTNVGEKRTCSPRCMFIAVLEKDVKDVQNIWVKEYYEQKEIDARQAFYVIGSDILGPMGKGLVPFKTKDDAQEFLQDHQGKKILKFREVSLKIIQEIIKK